jgi:hypothetical protein
MNDDVPADAQSERAELIEQALLMNLIFSLDSEPEGRKGAKMSPPDVADAKS